MSDSRRREKFDESGLAGTTPVGGRSHGEVVVGVAPDAHEDASLAAEGDVGEARALVPVNGEIANREDRLRALEALNAAAEAADSPEEAQRIMLQGRVLANALSLAREPFEDARLAGKASVVAARKLGAILSSLPVQQRPIRGAGRRAGTRQSERSELARSLGISSHIQSNLVRLAAAPDPDFQRYIQDRSLIPSISGALYKVIGTKRSAWNGSHSTRRRLRIGVKTPAHPSLDEAHSLIIRALGHLGSCGGAGQKDKSEAMAHLYAAEDLIRPHLGGYTDRRSA